MDQREADTANARRAAALADATEAFGPVGDVEWVIIDVLDLDPALYVHGRRDELVEGSAIVLDAVVAVPQGGENDAGRLARVHVGIDVDQLTEIVSALMSASVNMALPSAVPSTPNDGIGGYL